MNDFWIFTTMAAVCLLWNRLPVVHKPFLWMETFYHELSHGLAAMATFGRIRRIYLKLNGEGVCVTVGGWRLVVLLAGYAGAVVWGGLIFWVGWHTSTDTAQQVLLGLLGLHAAVVVFWVRDVQSLVIIFIISALFYGTLWLHPYVPWSHYALQFMGMYILQSAARAPFALIDGKHVGDGAALADLTFIPEGVWIALWVAFAGFALFVLWQHTAGAVV